MNIKLILFALLLAGLLAAAAGADELLADTQFAQGFGAAFIYGKREPDGMVRSYRDIAPRQVHLIPQGPVKKMDGFRFHPWDFQEGLQATYKSPFSVGAGMTYKLKTTSLYASLEWFGGVGEYVVIDGEDFLGQSSGKLLPSEVIHKVESVLNFALGVEQKVSRKFTLYGSFWSDYSARKGQTSTNLSIADFNLYHFMGGTTFTAFNAQFTLGIGYAFGHKVKDNRVRADLIGDIHFIRHRHGDTARPGHASRLGYTRDVHHFVLYCHRCCVPYGIKNKHTIVQCNRPGKISHTCIITSILYYDPILHIVC